MMFGKRILSIFLLLLVVITSTVLYAQNLDSITNQTDQIERKQDIVAYMNKTYYRDIHYSEELYKSFEKFYQGNSKYYICVPKNDFDLFNSRFSQMLMEKKIKKKPIIVAEETLFDDSSIEELKKLPGHEQQQVIKLEFWKYDNTITHYITFDSDITLTRPFDDGIFFDGKILKTVAENSKESAFAAKINSVFAEANSHKETHNKYFICAYGLWNVAILKDLEKFLQKTNIKSFTNMIKIAPVEMEWYGKFLYLFYYSEFKPQSPIIQGIQGFVSSNDYSALIDKSEICSRYCALPQTEDIIGVYLHYHTNHRSGYTLSDLNCSCEKASSISSSISSYFRAAKRWFKKMRNEFLDSIHSLKKSTIHKIHT